jgi:ABC-type dipeptide/oligopeptide/nickel transport system permease component
LLRFILRRTLYAVPSLLGLLIVTFLLIRVVPADPAAALAGDNATPQQIADIRTGASSGSMYCVTRSSPPSPRSASCSAP